MVATSTVCLSYTIFLILCPDQTTFQDPLAPSFPLHRVGFEEAHHRPALKQEINAQKMRNFPPSPALSSAEHLN